MNSVIETHRGWLLYPRMVILANAGDFGAVGWSAAVLFGILLWVLPQIFLIREACGVARLNPLRSQKWAFVGTIWGGQLLLALALRAYGARELRADSGAILLLSVLGVVWLLAAVALFPWLGMSLRDDAMERRNPAALVALLGAMVAVQLTFLGGNIGEGPSSWNNIFSAALGTGGVFSLWLMLEIGTDVSAAIAEDRDLASGLRLGGFLIGTGLILGRAVAGDWHSETATLHDFVHDGWPAAVLWLLALMGERRWRPTPKHPFPSWRIYGLLPALLYLALAAAWLFHVGAWEGFSR